MDRYRAEGERAGPGKGQDGEPPAAADSDEGPREAEARGTEGGPVADGSGGEALARIETELNDLQDRHLRLAAEFENYRKRTREELWESGARAQAALVGALLEALDDFQRVTSMDSGKAHVDTILEGVGMVERKLHRALAEAGAEILEPVGDPFDPETMEAVMKVPAESPEEDDTVDQVLQRGFLFKGHLVRPARVAVRKAD